MKKFFQKEIVEWGIYGLVFLLPWQTRLIFKNGIINGGISEYLTLSLYGIDLLIVALFLFTFFSQKKKILNFTCLFKEPSFKLLGLFFLLCAISIFWVQNKLLAFEHMCWVLLAVLLAFLISRTEDKIRLVYAFLMGLMLSAWLGIWQFLTQFAFSNKWLGLAWHDPKLSGVSVVEFRNVSGETIRWLRAYGSFDHPNMFGFMMALGIFFTSWLILDRQIKTKVEKNLQYFLLLIFSVGLFVSLSRAAWAGLLLFGAVMMFALRDNFFQKAKIFIAIALIFSAMIFLYPMQFVTRSGGEGRLEKKSLDERSIYLQQGKNMLARNWLTGVGIGNYVEWLKIENPKNFSWTYQPVHNVLLLLWAELGIFGALLFVTLVGLLAYKAWQQSVFALGLIVVFLPALMLDHWLWSLHFGVILLGFVVGFVYNGFDKKLKA